MLNDIRTTVAGNVTRAPEMKHRRSDGKPFVVIPIAVNERRWDASSQQGIEVGTTFYDVICGNGTGANALASLRVGTPVIAHGRLKIHEWETETSKGARPTIHADSVGIDLTWGTASYAKGSARYPDQNDGVHGGFPPQSEGGPSPEEAERASASLAQALAEGYRVDATGEVHATPGEVGPGSDDEEDEGLEDELDEGLEDELDEEALARVG